MIHTTYPTLTDALWPQHAAHQVLRAVALVATGVMTLALSAQLQIPLWPVPVTLQTLAVLLIGATYGPRLGAATIASYLLAGASGLPVFAGGSATAALFGPTAGYLFGFVVAGTLVGWCAQRGWDRSAWRMAMAMLLGNVVIYACGATWLAQFVGWSHVATVGVVPFIPGDIAKIAAAMWLLPKAWRSIA